MVQFRWFPSQLVVLRFAWWQKPCKIAANARSRMDFYWPVVRIFVERVEWNHAHCFFMLEGLHKVLGMSKVEYHLYWLYFPSKFRMSWASRGNITWQMWMASLYWKGLLHSLSLGLQPRWLIVVHHFYPILIRMTISGFRMCCLTFFLKRSESIHSLWFPHISVSNHICFMYCIYIYIYFPSPNYRRSVFPCHACAAGYALGHRAALVLLAVPGWPGAGDHQPIEAIREKMPKRKRLMHRAVSHGCFVKNPWPGGALRSRRLPEPRCGVVFRGEPVGRKPTAGSTCTSVLAAEVRFGKVGPGS